ncbi:hypothetical protein FRC12_019535 [Ceratobasidium sp. 428]|nr:hypothetical protein FRC09_017093 [Ceratobasidium sp. 395]KAG8794964.1 hypothetical protein FRC12_019535 [Ceratobasidium sp. 428]
MTVYFAHLNEVYTYNGYDQVSWCQQWWDICRLQLIATRDPSARGFFTFIIAGTLHGIDDQGILYSDRSGRVSEVQRYVDIRDAGFSLTPIMLFSLDNPPTTVGETTNLNAGLVPTGQATVPSSSMRLSAIPEALQASVDNPNTPEYFDQYRGSSPVSSQFFPLL